MLRRVEVELEGDVAPFAVLDAFLHGDCFRDGDVQVDELELARQEGELDFVFRCKAGRGRGYFCKRLHCGNCQEAHHGEIADSQRMKGMTHRFFLSAMVPYSMHDVDVAMTHVKSLGSGLTSICLHPGFIEGGMLHALAAFHEIAVDHVDRAVAALNNGRIVEGALLLPLQWTGPFPSLAFVFRN